ncbi:nucleoporin NUP42 [Pyxicephalus adspersus]|uniref:Nucleoporin NUP42 n=1 Tax=Pyxicephalus adspersus TaxID=30357 RepID=A0AAV3AID9_PYXAD|nr:TPA: hypothetical protein GDO54_012596 [Pyxicephalus adspersus]
MAICSFFLEGRCRYGDRCWNEHPRGGRRQEQNRNQYQYQQPQYQQPQYQQQQYQQPPAASRRWTSSNQRYVQPSNFSTWSRDNNQAASHSDFHDNRGRAQNPGSSAGPFSSQNRFSNLASQDQPREMQSDKDGSIFEDIKRDLESWESSGQWIFSTYCVIKDPRNLSGFADISPEELRLDFYTARDSGNMQNYVSSVQQLASQWKQRVHAIKNTNISSQSALMNELTKPATSSATTFGGQQNSAFPTASSSTNSAFQSGVNFSFKSDSQYTAPSGGNPSSFPSTSGFVNKPASGFGNATTVSPAAFSFAVTTASDGASSGFSNAKAVTASTFSFAPTTTSSAFSGFAATTTSLPASTPSTTSAVFQGTTAATSFGQSDTSVFGGASGFGNTLTSGFGSKTSAGPSLFGAGAASSAPSMPFAHPPAAPVNQAASVTTTAESISTNPLFTPQSELSANELAQFKAKRFTLGSIPLRPPPSDLLIV